MYNILSSGIGYVKILASGLLSIYYPVLMGLSLFYLVWCSKGPIPFTECSQQLTPIVSYTPIMYRFWNNFYDCCKPSPQLCWMLSIVWGFYDDIQNVLQIGSAPMFTWLVVIVLTGMWSTGQHASIKRCSVCQPMPLISKMKTYKQIVFCIMRSS